MAKPSISTRPLHAADLPEVLDLLKVSLGESELLNRTEQLFSWKHFDNPFGQSLARVAEADGRIVGLRAFMRWNLTMVDGTILQCLRAVDTATHPDYQRLGIFRRLTGEVLEQATETGLDLVFNTPNPRSGAGYLSMGWREVGKIGALVRPSLRFFGRNSTEHDASRPDQFLGSPVPAHDFEISDRDPLGLRTPRTSGYLKWRYSEHPTARYFQVATEDGIAFVRPNVRGRRRELLVADSFGAHREVIKSVIRESTAQYVGAWFPPGTPERRGARSNLMIQVPGLKTLTLMVRPLRPLDIEPISVDSFDFSIGDFELL